MKAMMDHEPRKDQSLQKLVSIVLPTHNGAQWLEQSIQSVLEQSYPNIELIIVDDCSTDSTPLLADAYARKDTRVRVIHNATNQKLPRSLNIGFADARGDYLTWTSDDNWYEPEAIEKMVAYLNAHDEVGMVACDFSKIDGDTGELIAVMHLNPSAEELLKGNQIGACFMYRRSVAERVGTYDEAKFLVEDYDYWLRIRLTADIGKIDETLYNYRTHDKSLSLTMPERVMERAKNLQLEMLPLYKKQFPGIDTREVEDALTLHRLLYHRCGEAWQKAVQLHGRKHIYRQLRDEYKRTSDSYYLGVMNKLGLKYKLKSWMLKLRVHDRHAQTGERL